MSLSLSTALRNELQKAGGSSLADALANGIIHIYDGSRPASADDTEGSSQLLCKITLASGAFTSGNATNGINLDVAAAGIVSKAVAEVWSGSILLSGTATWFRFYANTVVQGADDTVAQRLDGSISTSSTSDMSMPVTSLSQSGTLTLDSAEFELP